jgi:hypothetical protein
MNDGHRFRAKDPAMDPARLYPSFVSALAARYPEYRLVWDRDQQKWVVLHQRAARYFSIVAYVESGDGVGMPPSIEWLDELTRCEVLRNFATMDEYCDWLEKESERVYEEGCAALTEAMVYAARPYIDWVTRGGPESFVIRPFSAPHRRQLEEEIARDLPGAVIPQEAA